MCFDYSTGILELQGVNLYKKLLISGSSEKIIVQYKQNCATVFGGTEDRKTG